MSDQSSNEAVNKIQIGNPISSWEGLDSVTPFLHLEAPPVDPSGPPSPPNQSKYPNVVGTRRLAVTDSARNIRKRSWMGWFLWGDGTPPPGITPGYPVTEASPPQYNDDNWDYFSWQYSAGYDPSDVDNNNGQWKAVRLDQQPLYLNPFRVNYNWPAGKFGYEKQPLTPFANNVGYWANKKIVRGPNFSLAYPYMVEYANYVDKTKSPDFPDEWRNSWLYVHTRPLETLVMVPGIKTPAELLTAGTWNQVGNDHQPFPYPVWDETLAPADQTPFCLKVDRMGDWDADLIWEGTHANAKNYDQNKYQPTAFNEPGKGNYLKMTVAQGSPLVWCETNNSQYVNFYNLIRTNEPDHIDNTGGTRPTNAGMAIDPAIHQGVWDVPGVSDVQYVLLYGNQTNPNQFYHEVEPFKWNEQTGLPGGWNPPGKQSNYTYIAVYFKKDTVAPVDLSQHSGTDSDGNPYFYLQFKNQNQKNWYVVGAVPVMRYYHSEVPEDDEPKRLAAARHWAEAMGLYAFNFLTNTQISYEVANMYKATTIYKTSLTNPYVATGETNAQLMTFDSNKTVIALMPHHYQPITLGPDFTQSVDPNQPDANQVVWQPLQTVGADLPVSGIDLPNANKSDPSSSSYWGYWSPRGNLKTLATNQFVTQFLFQNFLPLLPPPNWDKEYQQTSVQGVRIVNVGTGYEKLPTDVEVPSDGALPKATIVSPGGSGAELKVILVPNSDKIQQIDVVYGGSGYPDGDPPQNVTVQIDAPDSRVVGGHTATARAQIGGGKVLAIFMNDHGAGYRSTIQITTTNTEQDTDPAVVLPRFADDGKNLLKGLANVVVGGAEWLSDNSATVTATVQGTGTNATAQVIKPGQILQIGDSGVGGFTSAGMYPSSGDPEADAQSVIVHVPPAAVDNAAQTMRVTEVDSIPGYFKILITDPGEGYSITDKTSVQCVTADNHSFSLNNIESDSGRIISASPDFEGMSFSQPFEVTFKATAGEGPPQREAKGMVYSGFSIKTVELTGETVSGYEEDMQVSFSGGDILPPGLVMPELTYQIGWRGIITGVSLKSKGSGFFRDGWFTLEGGKGFDAALRPILSEGDRGSLVAVKVVRSGSNYLSKIIAYTNPDNKPLDVRVEAGRVVSVDLRPGVDYSSFTTIPAIFLMNAMGVLGKSDYNSAPPKGATAKIHYTHLSSGSVAVGQIENGENYISVSSTATVDSLPLVLRYANEGQVVTANQAAGFIAEVAKPVIKVEQVLYDSIISRFSTLASNDLRPFGGGFGGASGPDGYGLGNALSSVAKVLGVLYHLQQQYASQNQDIPSVRPSLFAMQQTDNTNHKFEFPIYVQNNPLLSLKGSLKTMTQALQRTLTLFFQQQPYTNNPSNDTWTMAYFALYDKAGRVVVNPTATIPVYGIVSSTLNPPAISDSENQDKQGLNRWHSGMLWSGFGVSDQWNDQHYFYGYYLSTAALLALLDGAWSDTKPDQLWADSDQMGTAIDQWMKTLAYDPALEGQYFDFNNACQTNDVTYGKYSFFDQWNGHPWATGVSPGRAGDVEDGHKRGPTPWSIWSSYGTGNYPYDDENENSTWEGLQAYSSIILWGAGTNRKGIVDQGIYLLTTGNASSDLYFLDKNYNLKRSSANQYTWCPVTTGTPASQNGGNNTYPNNTGFVDSSPEAFYGEASAGCSILQKGSPSLNNFFYAFPTGSKFIQAYPPTPWTMGMTRNLSYMQKWADAMTRPEWKHARDSDLFQPGNWLGMAMTSALCGVPYNPGDDPTKAQPYADRVWSSWNVLGREPGSQATMQPAEQPTSVLNLLHVMEEYGAPDWSIYAKITDQTGAEADQIVFTAAFVKVDPDDASAVFTTLVAFNPGWEPGYVQFYRLGTDGLLANSKLLQPGSNQPIAVPPKKMVILTTLAATQPMSLIAALSNHTFVGVGETNSAMGQLFYRQTADADWIIGKKTKTLVTNIAILPVEFSGQLRPYPIDSFLGVSNGDLYFRPDLSSDWIALPNNQVKLNCVAVIYATAPGSSGWNGIYGITIDGKLVKRSQPESNWAPVSGISATKLMKHLVGLPVSDTNPNLLAGISQDGDKGAVFYLSTENPEWQALSGVIGFKSIANTAANSAVVVQPQSQNTPILTAAAKRSFQNTLNVGVTANTAPDPSPQILAATNPQYYRHVMASSDLPLQERTVIYHTNQQGLYISQDKNNPYVEYIDANRNLTICAIDVYLLGSISIPQGDVQIYCKTLTIPAGSAGTIDVSGSAPDLKYQSVKIANPQTSPPQSDGTGVAGQNGSDLKGTESWGDTGSDGGTIRIYCDTIQLDSDLTLNANGGQGYAGINGQDGGNGGNGNDGREEQHNQSNGNAAPIIGDSKITVQPGSGGNGGQGGNGLAGGCGGDGGNVTCTYRVLNRDSNDTASYQITANVNPGARGTNGSAGAGGIKGLAGTLTHYTYIDSMTGAVLQESHPISYPNTAYYHSLSDIDGQPRTYALAGTTPNPTQQGKTGAVTVAQVTTKDDQGSLILLDLGNALDDVFVLMLFQAISFRYLNCTPEQFSGTSITYSGGSSAEWQAILDLVNWLNRSVLSMFNKSSTDQAANRKYKIWQKVNTLATQLFTNKTYYGDPPNWIPRAQLTNLFSDATDAVTTLKSVEADFLTLANKYEDNSATALQKSEYANTLTQAKTFYEVGYLTIVGGSLDNDHKFSGVLAGYGNDVETANQAVEEYLGDNGKLQQASQELQDAVKSVFNFSWENLVQGLGQMVFCYHPDSGDSGGGGITPFKAMAAVQIGDLVHQGMTTITDRSGQTIQKDYLISQIKDLGDDLAQGFQVNFFNPDGTFRTDLDKETRYLGQLDQLEDKISDVAGKLNQDTVTEVMNVLTSYKDALVKRSDAILQYNNAIITAADYYAKYDDANQKLKDLQNSPADINPYDIEILQTYQQRYQEQIEKVLRYIYLARRKCAFWTLGDYQDDSVTNSWSDITKLWTSTTPGAITADSFSDQLNDLEGGVKQYYQKAETVFTSFPDEQAGQIKLSELHIEIASTDPIPKPTGYISTSSLISNLKVAKTDDSGQTYYEVSFYAVPEGIKHSQIVHYSNPAIISNSNESWDTRISNIRPHLVGAATNSGAVVIEIFNQGNCSIDANSNKGIITPTLYSFQQDVMYTSFKHATGFSPDGTYNNVSDLHQGAVSDVDETVGINGAGLDVLGVFGQWKLRIYASSTPGDVNYKLDMSGVTGLYIYFKGWARSKKFS